MTASTEKLLPDTLLIDIQHYLQQLAPHVKEREAAQLLQRTFNYLATPAQPAEGDEWLPIESAPKDGTHVLLWRDPYISEAWWRLDVFQKAHEWGGEGWAYPEWSQPTHWKPKPAAPMTAATQDTTQHPEIAEHTQPGITPTLDEQILYMDERTAGAWPMPKAILDSLIRLREIEGKLRDSPEPVAWALFTTSGLIRIWTGSKDDLKRIEGLHGHLTPLYAIDALLLRGKP